MILPQKGFLVFLNSWSHQETPLLILKRDNICHWRWHRKAGRHSLCLPQKVTDWNPPPTAHLNCASTDTVFSKNKIIRSNFGKRPLSGIFLSQSWTMLLMQQLSHAQNSLVLIPISNLSFASSELKPKCIHLPQGKGGSLWLPITYQQLRKALPNDSQQTLSGKPPER